MPIHITARITLICFIEKMPQSCLKYDKIHIWSLSFYFTEPSLRSPSMLSSKPSYLIFLVLLLFCIVVTKTKLLTVAYGHKIVTPMSKRLLSSDLKLEKLATLYLPFNYFVNGSAQFGYDSGAVEQIAYDPVDRIIYTAGDKIVQIIDLAHVNNPTIVSYKIFHDTAELTDIEYCNGFVLLARRDVGNGPDDIRPTSDCRKILIALEGEVYYNGIKLIDPLGGIGILTFRTSDLSRRYRYQIEHFTSFIDRAQDNTIAHDLEPESIALNDDETKAYISLQIVNIKYKKHIKQIKFNENNAIAEFDMKTDKITAIHPLGYKNWRFSKFDASDKDNGINIRSWPVLGMYQPDVIRYMNINGRGFIVSANEGSAKDFSGDVPNGFTEKVRAGSLTLSRKSPIKIWAKANGFENTILSPSNLGTYYSVYEQYIEIKSMILCHIRQNKMFS
ncbi:hypothetical protein KUTeg_002555 [Tegillarca granosa]|uniref:Choice-of-anchor I domain-containing protein n=1 Tax=Tegillarca granosa TaxID=220873 RepID=A0ABQ9FZ51_TEGGR|nr:hypothetical protein KUTeg_002555 [Tegillarca granosa]